MSQLFQFCQGDKKRKPKLVKYQNSQEHNNLDFTKPHERAMSMALS